MGVVNAQIEFAKLSDAVEIGQLSRDEIEYGLGWKYTAKTVTQLIKSKTKNVVVARTANDLAGFGVMTYCDEQANLDLLAVKSGYRRKHVGSAIVLWLEKVAVTAGAFNVFVQLREKNFAAFSLYEKLGYQELENIPGFYQGIENGIVMAKSLRTMTNVT